MSDEAHAFLETPAGPLRLWPGRTLAARVVRADGRRVLLAVAGTELWVAAETPLVPGDTVRLEVRSVREGRVELRVVRGADGR